MVGRAEPESGPTVPRPAEATQTVEPPFPDLLRERLQICLESIPIVKVAEGVGMSIESVRRYLRDGKPSSEFVFAVVTKLGVSAHWLFTGRGPWRMADRIAYDAACASPARLVGELTRRIAHASALERPRPSQTTLGAAKPEDSARKQD